MVGDNCKSLERNAVTSYRAAEHGVEAMARFAIVVALGVWLASTAECHAQVMKNQARPVGTDPAPSLVRVAPSGVVPGTATDCLVEGQKLKDVEQWQVSGTGVIVSEFEVKSDSSARLTVVVSAGAELGYREVRAIGASGISNLVVLRIDRLDPVNETEPNDDPAKANVVAVGQAVSGTLKKEDLDYYRFEAKAGARLTLEVEARRLGIPLAPVLTVMTSNGRALAQARHSRGVDQDCRLGFKVPEDGTYLLQVRDNTYVGADNASYRLRIDPAPFATAIFPLGGVKGQPLTITASGGTLPLPLTKTLIMPSRTGETVEVGPFEGPDGFVLIPSHVVAGEGKEVTEVSRDASGGESLTTLSLGTTVNGRLERIGEIDRFKVSLKKGEPVSFRIEAASLGSWLDSTLTLRDSDGNVVSENDDIGMLPVQPRQAVIQNALPGNPDSRIDFQPRVTGEYTLEVVDRYGNGGPEYAYRLEATPGRPDFSIALLFGDPALNQRVIIAGGARPPRPPGASGVLNLKPGGNAIVNFLITPEGNPLPIEVSAEGLPDGVTAAPVTVRPNGPNRPNGLNRGVQPSGGAIVLKVASDAPRSLSELRLVGTTKTPDGIEIRRHATASIPIDTVPVPVPAKPVVRSLASIPIRILGKERGESRARDAVVSQPSVIPPTRYPIRVTSVTVPGVLLQGGRMDIKVGLSQFPPKSLAFRLDAKMLVTGVRADASTSLGTPLGTRPGDSEAVIRVSADVDAPTGVHTMEIAVRTALGDHEVRTATVLVRPPFSIRQRVGGIEFSAERRASFWVGVERELGFDGPVEVELEGLPPNLKAVGTPRIASRTDGCDVVVERSDEGPKNLDPATLTIVGVARMPKGWVRVNSAIRPMVLSASAEK
jgi:hypothetical protein